MAFADAIRSANATYNDIADKLDLLLPKTDQSSDTTGYSTTSTSYVDLGVGVDATVSVVTGESVLVLAMVNIGHATSGNEVYMQVTRNGTVIGTGGFLKTYSTVANQVAIPFWFIDSGATGSLVYKIQWKVAAGTGYADMKRIIAITLRTS